MPTYLCHGFRWHRLSIRIFVIIHDLEDAAPDWIIGYDTTALILDQLYENFDFLPQLPSPAETPDEGKQTEGKAPEAENVEEQEQEQKRKPLGHQDEDMSLPPPRVPDSEDAVLMHQWTPIRFLEEYDLNETEVAARPYAYVADHVVRVDLSADIAAEMAKYEANAKKNDLSWFEQLRDKMQPGEEMRWYVVVCDDEERARPEEMDEDDDEVKELSDVEEVDSMEVDSLPHRPTSISKAEAFAENPEDRTTPTAAKAPESSGSGSIPETAPIQDQQDRARAEKQDQDGQKSSKTLKSKQSISKGLRRLLGKKDKS